ncbi:MAG: DUF1015 family protein, partial [Actinomycetota bacterium]
DRRQHLAEHPRSYLGVTRSIEDVDPAVEDPETEAIRLSRASLEALLGDGAFGAETEPGFYLYRLETDDHHQTGLVCGVASADYEAGQVRIHEQIKQARADILARHLSAVGAQSSPIAMAFGSAPDLVSLMARITADSEPVLDIVDDDLRQTLWAVTDPGDAETARRSLAGEDLYLIDGHHRAAAAATHRRLTGDDQHLMLSVIFPFDELRSETFHRILRPVDTELLLAQLTHQFPVTPAPTVDAVMERASTDIAVAIGGDQTTWYLVELPPPLAEDDGATLDIDPVRLRQHVLQPLFGIDESGADPRLVHRPGPDDADAVGRLRLKPGQVAFWMRPVPASVLLEVADRGGTMPPKSTYFVPKVRSGLFIRLTDPLLADRA